MHGRGRKIWSKRDYYEGDYLNDKQHGKGTYYFANGEKYEGDY